VYAPAPAVLLSPSPLPDLPTLCVVISPCPSRRFPDNVAIVVDDLDAAVAFFIALFGSKKLPGGG